MRSLSHTRSLEVGHQMMRPHTASAHPDSSADDAGETKCARSPNAGKEGAPTREIPNRKWGFLVKEQFPRGFPLDSRTPPKGEASGAETKPHVEVSKSPARGCSKGVLQRSTEASPQRRRDPHTPSSAPGEPPRCAPLDDNSRPPSSSGRGSARRASSPAPARCRSQEGEPR